MTRELIVVGLSWRTAPVSVRERLAFSDAELDQAFDLLRDNERVAEAMIISTCNRVEVYAAAPRSAPESARDTTSAEVRSFLARSRGVDSEALAGSLYEHAAADAVRHIFRVASSLESMVLGETQILGQLKDAYGRATTSGAAGSVLSRCLERAFRVAKRVRSETEIARGAANVSSVAVELAVRVFGNLTGKSVALLGAGKMGALAARHLRAAGASQIAVANRSRDKAVELAAEVDGRVRDWEQLDDVLTSADVVISSTASRDPVLVVPRLKRIAKKRRYRPLVIVDIAVPRDADPKIGSLDGLYLFDIDDLEKVVAENVRLRSHEAAAASAIVEAEALAFESWNRSRHVVPTIRSLRHRFLAVAEAEAERAAAELGRAGDEVARAAVARKLADRIAKKLLHAPMMALKTDDDRDVEELVDLTRRLFALDDDSSDAGAPTVAAESLDPAKKAE